MMDIHSRLHLSRSRSTLAGDPLVQIGKIIRSENRVLCFDEFQVSDIADAMILKRLFGAFWGGGGVVVATSNREPRRLYEKGLNRDLFLPFIEELERRCDVWRLEGERDYRMAPPSDEKRLTVFFTSEQEFLDSLDLVTGGKAMEALSIPVMMGRTLHVNGTGVGESVIVQTTFKTLCEANLGSADYHALCKTTSTIYLSGLRQFRSDELDFVRRFITLIDIAYESRSRIICLSSINFFEVFSNISSGPAEEDGIYKTIQEMSVKGQGGSSSSMMSTFIGETEWSATGLRSASLASGGAGESDVKFAVGRAMSRLFEMGSLGYGVSD
jgi:protein AFG1